MTTNYYSRVDRPAPERPTLRLVEPMAQPRHTHRLATVRGWLQVHGEALFWGVVVGVALGYLCAALVG